MHAIFKDSLRDERGGLMATTAVLMPVIIGFCGLGVDASGWLMQQRHSQILTDMTAVEAAHQAKSLQDQALMDEVEDFMEGHGFDEDTDVVTINTPPQSGAYVGETGFVEIIHRRDVPLHFASVFSSLTGNDVSITVSSRAVAGGISTGEQCFYSLDRDIDRAIEVKGNATVSVNCGISSNSVSNEAVYIGGDARLTADPARAVGDIAISGGGELITNSPLQPYSDAVEDPYESLDVPPDQPCDHTMSIVVNSDDTLEEGVFCGDLRINSANVTFAPGTYIFKGSSIDIGAGANITGDGVTIILTGDTPSSVGDINVNGMAAVNLTAPAENDTTGTITGDYAGILLYQDRIAESDGNSSSFNGGADLNLSGVVYMPKAQLNFSGGSDVNPTCLHLVAAKLTFSGDNELGNDTTTCESLSLSSGTEQIRIQLVE